MKDKEGNSVLNFGNMEAHGNKGGAQPTQIIPSLHDFSTPPLARGVKTLYFFIS
jgi:hypothetical protein